MFPSELRDVGSAPASSNSRTTARGFGPPRPSREAASAAASSPSRAFRGREEGAPAAHATWSAVHPFASAALTAASSKGPTPPGARRTARVAAAPYSRAVRIEVDDRSDDPADWTARQVWDHVLEDPKTGTPAFAPFVSDADALPNGNILVTHGGLGGLTSFQHIHILEYVPEGERNGDVVWELQLGVPGDEITIYRADRWESLYFGPLWESP